MGLQVGQPKKPVRHPWDKWFQKSRFNLVRGKHFGGMPHAMAVQVRNAASLRGYDASVYIDGNTLAITIVVSRRRLKARRRRA